MQFHNWCRPLMGAVVLVLAAVQGAEAQQPRPRPGQFEVHELDFRPKGAWRQRAAKVRAERQALLAAGNFAQLNSRAPGAAAPVVTGDFRIPVVPLQFSNTNPASTFSPAAYQDALFSPAPVGRPYSMTTYYQQLSNGLITMGGTVFPWVTADSSDLYYEDGCSGIGTQANACQHPGPYGPSVRLGQLLLQGLAAISNGADSSTVWAQFDNDGPDGVPNSGDDDGYVDFVAFIHPEVDGACGTPNLWAHRWVIEAHNNGSPYVTKTVAAGGGRIRISDYIVQSGVGGSGSCTAGQMMPIGVVTHETGHAFGLPDLYDITYNTEGIGEYGLMGAGSYATALSPSRMMAWSLAELGWVTVDTLKTSGTITLNPVASSDTVRVLPTQTPGEYFLFENRAALESDTAQMNPAFVRPKSPGLYIWHIDQARINSGALTNTVNTGAIQGVALMQADGLNQLRASAPQKNRGDAGDAFPGTTGNTVFDAFTNPSLRTNGGKVVPGRIDSIRIGPSNEVLFRYRVEYLVQVTKFGTGTGTIQSSTPGNPSDGISVTPGTVVTLTALPSAGHHFAGWTGDTTTTNPELVVTADRNWVLTAQFTFVAPFTTAAAANDLLGIPTLSAAQRGILDADGNNNGTYDLGDFLAWVTLSGQGVPPEVMARLIAAADAPKGATR